jgi:hypothetical protein
VGMVSRACLLCAGAAAEGIRSSFKYNPFGVLDTFSLDDGRSKPYNKTSFLAEITCPLK